MTPLWTNPGMAQRWGRAVEYLRKRGLWILEGGRPRMVRDLEAHRDDSIPVLTHQASRGEMIRHLVRQSHALFYPIPGITDYAQLRSMRHAWLRARIFLLDRRLSR